MPTPTTVVAVSPRSRAVLLLARLVLVAAAAHAVVVVMLTAVLPEDDAFITYRHAENLATGRGLVFTPGERVLGTTTPLYAVVLAPVRLLSPHRAFPAVALRLGVVWLLASACLLLALLRQLGVPAPLRHLAAAWLLLLPQSLATTLGGMEPFFVHTLFLAAFLLAAHGRWPAAGLLASVSVLARPEGVVVIAALSLAWWLSGKAKPVQTVLATALPGVVWIIVAGLYYGSPVPASVVAKAAVRGTVTRWDTARHLADESGRWLLGGEAGLTGQLTISLVVLLLVGYALHAAHSRPVIVAAEVWLLLHTTLYVVGNPAWYPWYGALLLAPWWLAVVIGMDSVSERIGRRWVATAVVSAMTAAQAVGAVAVVDRPGWPGTAYEVMTPYRLRIQAYQQAAEFLNQRLGQNEQVLSSEIGMLGWTLDKPRVLDSLGLVSPSALPFLPKLVRSGQPLGSISSEMVLALRPAAVLVFPMFSRGLDDDQGFAGSYVRAGVFTVPGRDYPAFRLALFLPRARTTGSAK